MANKELITTYLDKLLPNASCELNYHNLFELLIAVILSAQTTDASVNKVTPNIFKKYPTCKELGNAKTEDVEKLIKSIGLYHNKAKSIIGASKILHKEYNDIMPNTMEELIKLPGVGRKVASVILVEGYHLPAFPVDTHVNRVSKRLGIAKEKDSILTVERKLKKLLPSNEWGKVHHQLIHFGRYFCTARNPKCSECELKNICKYYLK